MFGWEFPPYNSGGLGVACKGLAEALGHQNIQIIFVLPQSIPSQETTNITFRFGDNCTGHIIMRPIQSWILPYDSESSYRSRTRNLADVGGGHSLYDAVKRYAAQAAIIAAQESFDIIHAHDWLSFGAGLAAKEVSGKPLIAQVHATEYDRNGGAGNPLIHTLEQHGLYNSDHVIAVSNFTKQKITRHYDIPESKISVVHNGIDLASEIKPEDIALKLHSFKHNNDMVLFLGRITLQKGPDYFIKAAKQVLSLRPKTIFVMAGSGDMLDQIMQESAAAGIAENIYFPGFVRGQALHSLYQAADIYIMPSVSEPFGIVALESLAKGTPIIISKQSGVSEVISHALKVDFWDTEALADRIIAVLDDPALAGQLREQGKAEASLVTWDKAAQTCKHIYEKVLETFQKKKKSKKK